VEPNYFELLRIERDAPSYEVVEAIEAARARWGARRGDPRPGGRLLAAQRLEVVARAEDVLLDERRRVLYLEDLRDPARPWIGHEVVGAPERLDPVRLDLPVVVTVGQLSDNPFAPLLNQDKSPALLVGETYLGSLLGHAAVQYSPWPGALEEPSFIPGAATLYVTSERAVLVAPDFVAPNVAPDHVANRETFLGMAAGFAFTTMNQARLTAAAQAQSAGRAVALQIPWEFLDGVFVAPAADGAGSLALSITAARSSYVVHLVCPGMESTWLRAQGEWLARVAVAKRLLLLGDDALPSERALLDRWLDRPECSYEPDGTVTFDLPFTFDASALPGALRHL